MTPDREREIERICQEALERPRGERETFLSEACRGDVELRREIDQLLAHERGAEGFLSEPALAIPVEDRGARGPALRLGQQLGGYTVLSSLGSGGMGEVYRARDATLGRDVAIKVLPPVFTGDRERLARFEREARVLAALNHPNIATIHGVEHVDGMHALVLEVVEGETLQDRVRHRKNRSGLPLSEVLSIARQVADALEAAHEKGIIHRDLKPANIKIRPDGVVKVLDFGLAKTVTPAAPVSDLADAPSLIAERTHTGVLMGTVTYMSPEQVRGRPADRRVDLWAFGCVLYELLTGRAAFAGETASDTIAAILGRDVDWSALPKATPASIRRLLQRCITKESAHRLRDIADARLELEEANQPNTVSAIPVPGRRRTLWIAAASGAALALAGALVVSFARSEGAITTLPLVARFSEPLEPRNLTLEVPNIALSPDGQQIVYGTQGGLYLRSMSDPVARLIPGTANNNASASSPAFSPDGQSIAFFSGDPSYGGTIRTIATTGGASMSLLQLDFPPDGISWHREQIVFGRGFGKGPKGVLQVSRRGGPEELLIPTGDEFVLGPQVLPDGQTILFTIATGLSADRWDKARIVVQSLTSKHRKTLIEGGSDARYLMSGHIVYASGDALFAVPFDLRKLEVTGRPAPVVQGVTRANPLISGATYFAISRTGSLVYISIPPTLYDLAKINRDGTASRFKFQSGPYHHPRVSPDGTRIAVGTRAGAEDIVWVGDLDGSGALRRLTFEGRNAFPIWSADGERVTFQSERDGGAGIVWQRTDGSSPAESLTTALPGTSHEPEVWSPSGEHLLFRVASGSQYSLWVYTAKTRRATPFGNVESSIPLVPVFSPDGRWVAYNSREADKFLIFVQPFPPTGAKYQIVEGGILPVWSRNGRELFYFHGLGMFSVVHFLAGSTPAVGSPMDLWPQGQERAMMIGRGRGFDPTPDGKFVSLVPATLGSAADSMRLHVVLNWFEELKQRFSSRN